VKQNPLHFSCPPRVDDGALNGPHGSADPPVSRGLTTQNPIGWADSLSSRNPGVVSWTFFLGPPGTDTSGPFLVRE
jgi:hypothetical protein